MYQLSIVTVLTTGVLTHDGRILHDTTVRKAKPCASIEECVANATKFFEEFPMQDNQYIKIEPIQQP